MAEIELSDLELADFEEINKTSAGCIPENKLISCDDADKDKKMRGFKVCLSRKLADFAIDAEARCISNKPYFLTSLESKEFLIDGSFKTISIKFLMRAE